MIGMSITHDAHGQLVAIVETDVFVMQRRDFETHSAAFVWLWLVCRQVMKGRRGS